ncbi:MAG: IS66 family insertion sequence element accessory protein TnpB [Gammaproteobacteria bacterium]
MGKYFYFIANPQKIKILYWDKNGFCLWYKRLEKGSFKIPDNKEKINYEQVRWLLDGLDINNLQRHKKLNYNTFFLLHLFPD